MLFNILTVSYSTSPQPPPLLQMQDGGGVLFCNQLPIPSLLKRKTEGRGFSSNHPPTPSLLEAQDRGRGFSSNHPPYSLPLETCSKHKTEGGGFSSNHPPTPSLLETQDGGRGFSSTTPTPSHSNARLRREVLLPLPPSLARNARWRDISSSTTPPYSLPCSKRKMEGGCFFAN